VAGRSGCLRYRPGTPRRSCVKPRRSIGGMDGHDGCFRRSRTSAGSPQRGGRSGRYSLTLVRGDRHVRRRGRAGRTLKPLKLGKATRASLHNMVAYDAVVVANGSVPSRVDGNPLPRVARPVESNALRRGIPRAPVKVSGLRDTCDRPQSSAPQTGRHQQRGC
jgi:hypothetical protein